MQARVNDPPEQRSWRRLNQPVYPIEPASYRLYRWVRLGVLHPLGEPMSLI